MSRFTCMGPSPLWAQCVVGAPVGTLEDPVEVKVIETPGYAWTAFKVRAAADVATVEDAYELVQTETVDALGTYYDLISAGNLLRYQRQYIEAELEELVATHRAHGSRAWFKRILAGGSKTNNLTLEVIAAEIEQERVMRGAQENWAELQSKAAVEAFDHLFQDRVREDAPEYLSNVRAVTDLMDNRQTRDVQVVSVIIASILGGAVGAAITAMGQLIATAAAGGS